MYFDQVPPDVPEREPGGVLLADVVLELEQRVPSKVDRIYLIPILKDRNMGERPARRIGLDVAEALRTGLREDLTRARASELARLEAPAINGLTERIRGGEFGNSKYQAREARAFEAVNRMSL